MRVWESLENMDRVRTGWRNLGAFEGVLKSLADFGIVWRSLAEFGEVW